MRNLGNEIENEPLIPETLPQAYRLIVSTISLIVESACMTIKNELSANSYLSARCLYIHGTNPTRHRPAFVPLGRRHF